MFQSSFLWKVVVLLLSLFYFTVQATPFTYEVEMDEGSVENLDQNVSSENTEVFEKFLELLANMLFKRPNIEDVASDKLFNEGIDRFEIKHNGFDRLRRGKDNKIQMRWKCHIKISVCILIPITNGQKSN
jgi:hypothetical protein